MELTKAIYLIFEANQVLTSDHLNHVREYLDKQERLTRANLIGIGIVCGLELQLDAQAGVIHLSKGCSVTSEGYLIIEPEDATLVTYRDYKLPEQVEYLPFLKTTNPEVQFDLWELFPAGEPGTTALNANAQFLNDKVVVLFMELKQAGLRNCSANNCDDRGSEVTAQVRRLLITRSDLDKVIAAANNLSNDLTSTDLDAALQAQLRLPDLRLPRYDVPNTKPVTSEQVLAAFGAVFQSGRLSRRTEEALTAAYQAFKPLLQEAYPFNPFGGFRGKFKFLDASPNTTAQARFLQYYFDLFDDVLGGYNEFRWKGLDLMCACCPPEGLFPRHLMLGLASPAANPNSTSDYRQHFMRSPAVSGCEDRVNELLMLFKRLVAMVERFTNTPLPELPPQDLKEDPQIRITPSRWGDVPLSNKAIPYYYRQNGTTPLYKVWDPLKTQRKRANQNLSYRSDEYVPAAPAFVTDALRFDLEPNNFLRIEGHLGKNVGTVLNTLLSLKSRYRLPIEVIALRTGAFDERMQVDLSKEDCSFQDLESLYDTLKAELICFLCKEVQYFYDLPSNVESLNKNGIKPTLPLLIKCDSKFMAKPGTLGELFEERLSSRRGESFIDLFGSIRAPLFNEIVFLDASPQIRLIYALILGISNVSEQLSPDLKQVNFATLERLYANLERLAELCEREHDRAIREVEGNEALLAWEEFDDRLEDILYHCRLEAFKALRDEYKRRVLDVKRKQFLSDFLQKNPGIQHKAGVPLGGTFILVYHDAPAITRPDSVSLNLEAADESIIPPYIAARYAGAQVTKVLSGALSRVLKKGALLDDPDVQVILEQLTGQKPVRRPDFEKEFKGIYARAVEEMEDGAVIADFFLPYMCCSDCSPIHYMLPMPKLGLKIELGCTNSDGMAEATFTPQGATGKVYYQVDNGSFTELTGNPLLSKGQHTIVIRDDAGAESAPQTLNVPEPLSAGQADITEDQQAMTYQVRFAITGGTPPFAAGAGVISNDNTFTSPPVNSGEEFKVTINDKAGCEITQTFKHTIERRCNLPCDGKTLRCGYPFWMPESTRERPYKSYQAGANKFVFDVPGQGTFDFTAEVTGIIQSDTDALNNAFADVVNRWLKQINSMIADKTGSEDWLKLEFEPSADGFAGTLWIERLACIEFQFDINALFQKPEVNESINTIYLPREAVITVTGANIERRVTIPAFNCVEIDKCDPDRPSVKQCEGTDLTLDIVKETNADGMTHLSAKPAGNDQPVAFLWEVQDGIPPISDKPEDDFKFEQTSPTTKNIRLTAYTNKGCRVVKTDKITLRRRNR